MDYAALDPWIEQQRQQPHAAILTPEKIHSWQRTSGSTGAVKWIPYTTSLMASFSAMFCVWLHDLIQHGPPFSTAKSYLCISPQIGNAEAGLDDSAFLDGSLRWMLDRFFVRVDGPFTTADDFHWKLALALLETADLELFSLWSPSFLTVQLDFIQAHRQELQTALRHRISAQRLKLLTELEIPWTQLWPELKMISCWDRMFAADQASTLRHKFPGIFIQGKGLLATEGAMTIPLIPAQGFVPLVNQVVLEFLDPQGQVKSLTELQSNTTYELVISPLGGLMRYRIGDRVRMTHLYHHTPCLEFVGRGEQVSDLVGEKLTEEFVATLLKNLGVTDWGFCCLAPVADQPPHYCLFLERSPEEENAIATKLEAALRTGVHYEKARALGQLSQVQVVIDSQVPIWLQAADRRPGDAKYSLLRVKPWHKTRA